MREAELHQLIIENEDIQNSILSLLSIEDKDMEFCHEDKYPNGLYADFTIKKDVCVKAIMECKGSEIGANDFVRGIGQVMQYQHFADEGLSLKGYYYDNAHSVYCFPSNIIKNKDFNIGLFKYPDGCKIIELNEQNKNVRLITENEMNHLASATKNDLVTISQYYIRDNRLYELYICLRYCLFRKMLGDSRIDRKQAETGFLRKLDTPNNRNWRNAFISLSSLGLIDNNNLPTITGSYYASNDYANFCYEIYKNYIKDFIDLLMNSLIEIQKYQNINFNDEFKADYSIIAEYVASKNNNKKVLYLTDSGNRYLSSWLNIMRDDYNCIDFHSRNNNRVIKYNIEEVNKETLINKIRGNQVAKEYIDKMVSLLRTDL